MPFHLPSLESSDSALSRRKFLKRALLAGSGMVIGTELWAGPSSGSSGGQIGGEDWAFLSDTHIAADRAATANGTTMALNLRRVIEEIVGLEKKPGALLVNGDCSFRYGLAEDYAVFNELLDPVRKAGVPVHLTLGNHDGREAFMKTVTGVGEQPVLVNGHHVTFLHGEQVNWILLDSLTNTNGAGTFGPEQRLWLAEILDVNTDKPAIVVGHHNLDDGKSFYPLTDTESFMEILAPRKQVKAYMFGHSHKWSVETHESGVHLINLPPTAYVFGPGRPNGWVHAQVGRTGMRLELKCLDSKHERAGEVRQLAWRS